MTTHSFHGFSSNIKNSIPNHTKLNAPFQIVMFAIDDVSTDMNHWTCPFQWCIYTVCTIAWHYFSHMWFDLMFCIMVVPMLAAYALMGISIRKTYVCSLVYDFITSRDPCLCYWFVRAALTWLMLLCNGACRWDCRSGTLCLGRVTVCPFRDRALVNFIHRCPILGWAAGPLPRGAAVVASTCPMHCNWYRTIFQFSKITVNHSKINQHIYKHITWVTHNYLVKLLM